MKKTSKNSNKRKEKSPAHSSDYLSVTLRDSGIVEDGDDSSETSSLNRASINNIPSCQVKNRIQLFEFLAQERNESQNWRHEEPKKVKNEEIEEKEEVEEEKVSRQTSLKSQISEKSQHDEPETQNIPEITFDDAEDEGEVDNKSFISENSESEEEIVGNFVRNSSNRLRMSRPASITSQASM